MLIRDLVSWKVLCTICVTLIASVCCANINDFVPYKILVLNPGPSKSHYNLGKAVADILHNRGHEITFISAFSSNSPGYREIVLEKLASFMDKQHRHFAMLDDSIYDTFMAMNKFITIMSDITLSDTEVQKLLNDKNEKFDLVIVEYFMNEVLTSFGPKFKCPVVMLSSVSMMHWLARNTGNPISPAIVPNVFLGFTSQMSLMDRVANTLMSVFQELLEVFVYRKTQVELYEKYFPEVAAEMGYDEMKKNISLVLINSHPSIGGVRPLLPNAVEIGGYHISDPGPLPKEYLNILDNSKDGVILFSMGSHLKSSEMPESARNDILKAFSKLKQTVIWKFEADLPGLPKNVIIKSWVPQTSLMAHPNMKLFISHGGLLSTTEAAASGVPILAIPIFGDQFHNARITAQRGNGLALEFVNLTESSLTWALEEMLTNSKYGETAKSLQKLFLDRPVPPRDLVSFYVEHVVRTGGAPHLSAPPLGLFATLLLDVLVVLLVPPLFLLLIVTYLCRKQFMKARREQDTKEKKKQQ